DGAITRREVNMNEQVGGFHGHHDGERIFISIGLGFEGDNIKTVEFIAQKGVFATQHMSNFDKNKPHSGFSTEYGGRRVLMLGYNFEMAGERLVFEQNYIDNDLLIFWSIEADRNDFIPSDAEFMVIVTFDDGEVIYDMFTINFGDRFGMITIYTSEEEQAAMLAASIREWEFYSNLSLDEMVHVADAVITRVPQYDEMFGGVEMYSACFGIMISFYDRDGNLVEFVQPATRFSHNFMEFDERGMVLWEINHSEDGVSSYIAFFMQDDYGNISFRRFLAPRFAE
ncbi:MAG: hypothetical protein FWC95_00875, partial [Defluviitaleaceae bacterium]|nr:hypothetical protein [Defluviitaleaceae bacterium]